MSFPRYKKYKPSGVEWLGDVPEHWEPIRFKNVFREKVFNSGVHLQAGSISFGRVVFKDDEAMNEGTKATYQEVLRSEFLINPINLNYDLKSLRTALSEIDTCVSPAYIVLQAKIDLDRSFMKHQLSMFDVRHMKTLGAGVRQTITFSDIGVCFTQLPPLHEQTAIAAFLDRETEKIDELVEEQRLLMELLKEKRQAVISHAVTQGLNPKAPMKPSGIEWLGDVPEHWKVVCAKRVSSIFVPQRNKPELNTDGDGVCWMTMEQMRSDEVDVTDLCVSETAAKAAGTRVLKAGAVIASCVGTFGLATINTSDVIINQQLQAFVPEDGIEPKFLRHCVMKAGNYFEQIGTAATITYVNQTGFENMPLAVPPLDEQKEIISHLDIELAKLDTLTAEAQRAIDLLQERRTALISAAVTGQIDVRNS